MKKLLVILAMSGAPLWAIGILVDIGNSNAIVKAIEDHGGVALRTEIELNLRLKNVKDGAHGGKLQYAKSVIPTQYSRVWSVLSAVGVARSQQATQLNYLWGSTDGIYDILASIRELLIGESSFAGELKASLSEENQKKLNDILNSLPLGRTSSWFQSDRDQLKAYQTKIFELVADFNKIPGQILAIQQAVKFLNIYKDAINDMDALIDQIALCGLSTRMWYWGKRAAVPVVVGGTVYCLYKNSEVLGGAASSAEEVAGKAARALADKIEAAGPAATAAGAKAAEVFTEQMKNK